MQNFSLLPADGSDPINISAPLVFIQQASDGVIVVTAEADEEGLETETGRYHVRPAHENDLPGTVYYSAATIVESIKGKDFVREHAAADTADDPAINKRFNEAQSLLAGKVDDAVLAKVLNEIKPGAVKPKKSEVDSLKNLAGAKIPDALLAEVQASLDAKAMP